MPCVCPSNPPSTPPARPGRRVRLRRVVQAALLLAGGLGVVALGAAADRGRDDHERARAARERGEMLPLDGLLAEAERRLGGRVIEVELEDEEGVPVYEFELLLADGRVLELELDARDGRWLKLKGPRLETLFPRAAGAR